MMTRSYEAGSVCSLRRSNVCRKPSACPLKRGRTREDFPQVVHHFAVALDPRSFLPHNAARFAQEDVDEVAMLLQGQDDLVHQRLGRVDLRLVSVRAAAVGGSAAAAEGLTAEQHGDAARQREAGGDDPVLAQGEAGRLGLGLRLGLRHSLRHSGIPRLLLLPLLTLTLY
eukprot:scaffold59566_cov36-Phaeocystis_antarctica.AAC.1